jgi:hypothetical protein
MLSGWPLLSSDRGARHALLKYCTARSCFWAATREEKVPRFFRFPVFASFFREYKRYSPDCSLRIMQIKDVIRSFMVGKENGTLPTSHYH